MFNKLVYSSIKNKLGLDQAEYILFGAAPMPAKTRNFFFDLGMYVDNVFGMSETAGPMTGLFKDEYMNYNLKSAGRTIDGTKAYVLETGELCFRGRNVLMGYLKNEEATRSTIDELRRLHSGDKGEFDQNGNIMITGRIKELLKTAGGEYVAPVIIENIIKENMPFVSNAMVIGDQRKFVSCLLTIKTTTLASDAPNRVLDPETAKFFAANGIPGAKTVDDVVDHPSFKQLVQKGNF